jgi:hypothetical protein
MGVYVPERKSLRYSISTPPVRSHGDAARCWAAALESWLEIRPSASGVWDDAVAQSHGHAGLPWERKPLTMKNMYNLWGDLTKNNESLTPDGIRNVALDIGMRGD